ncbi:MAG: glycosyltransferase family 9 protein [Planctomycetota bacterium]|jgi:lipopolysaccharide heptosyltransferase I
MPEYLHDGGIAATAFFAYNTGLMTVQNKNLHPHRAGLETAPVKLAHGWIGLVALSDSSGNRFTAADWENCLADPNSLCSNSDKTLKIDTDVSVVVKTLLISDKKFAVVVKSQRRRGGIRNLLRSILPARAIRNFHTARRLHQSNVPVARPLAALWQKTGPFTNQSIYITEYVRDSADLHSFLRDNTSLLSPSDLSLKRHLCSRIAHIFASMHKACLWHRDAKAGNFLVHKGRDNRYEITLVDMDGIKPYGFRRRNLRYRCLAKLAATLLWHKSITKTDYLRTFTIYSNLIGPNGNGRKRIFRTLSNRAAAIRLLTMANASMKTQKIKRILIIKPSALGDVALALPAFASLRTSLPDAKISWLIRSEYAPLLECIDGIDDIILFDRKLLGKCWYNPKAFAALVHLVGRLRQGRFDVVIDLQGLLRTALFGWLANCKKRFGMKSSREFANLFYTHKIPQSNDIHLIDYYQKIVSAVGASVKTRKLKPAPMSKAEDNIADLLSEHGVRPDGYAVFVPGSAHTSKCWPAENFAVLADKIASQFDLSIIGVGTRAEKPLVEKVVSTSNVPVANLAGLTNIPQLTALLKGARIVLSNDTGPAHIAAVMDVPTVIIFGATNPARIKPYGRPNTVAAIDPDKRGREIESPNPKYAIKAVTVEHVLEKVTYQLQQY